MYKKITSLLQSFFFKNPFGTQNSKNRNAWLEKNLKRIPPGYQILDAGAGNTNKKKYCGHLDYVSQDFAEYSGTEKSSGLHTGKVDYSALDIVSDITDIPVEDVSFDAIMCIEVIEHIKNPLLAFEEFSRILKKDGILILTAPFNSLTHYAPHHYAVGFNKFYYEEHLPNYGFEIIELTSNGNFYEYLAQELRRLKSVSKEYSGARYISPIFYLSTIYILNFLKRQSKKDSNSNDLSCFGYNLIARKIN
jgi:ubiquinone/menaquinone biosynthesis C-methylase UbiE